MDRSILEFFNGSNSLFVDGLAVIFTSWITWIPLYLSLLYIVIKNNDFHQIILVVSCVALALVLSDAMADFIVKPLVGRLRPSLDPKIMNSISIVNGLRGSGYSFFSAHASNTFSIALFFSLLVRSRTFIIAIVLWSMINCWTRLYLGLHYPSDVLVGIIWGAIAAGVAYMVYYRLYMRISSGFNYISSKYTSTGYNREDLDIVLLVLVLTLIYVVIRALIPSML